VELELKPFIGRKVFVIMNELNHCHE